MDLDKLLADYKGAYLSYPQVRRDVEFKLMAALVEEVKALKARRDAPDIPPVIGAEIVRNAVAEHAVKRGPGRPPKVEEAA